MSAHRFSPAAQCGSKRQLRSKAQAKSAIRGVERHYGVRLDCYRCEWCGFWHLGHKPSPEAYRREILCAGCGRPWRPRVRYDRDGTLLWQRDADPARCSHCQPSTPEEAA